MAVTAYIALGSNLGDRKAYLYRALDALLGPVFYRALITGGPISAAFTDQLVFEVLG